MSELVFAVLWALTIFGAAGTYWIIDAQEAVANELNKSLAAAEEAVVAENWPVAAAHVRDVYTRWRRIERVWTLHTHHELLEVVTETLLEAGALVDLQDVQAVTPLRRARYLLETLPSRDRLLLENLL